MKPAGAPAKKKKNYSVDKDVQRLGYILPFMVIGLITGPYFFVVPYILLPKYQFSFYGLCNIGFSSWIVSMILLSYYKSIFTPPGSIPPGWRPDEESGLLGSPEDPAKPHVRFCTKCNVPKPERAHHCRVCDRCTLKMDHHCPWINNCVGHKNHKYFLLFLIYATVGITYCLTLIVISFLEALKESKGAEDFLTIFGLTILATIMLPIGLAIIMLLSWQLWLVGTNTTSIENEEFEQLRYTTKREGKVYTHVNVYNLGNMANFKAVLGPQVLWWWLPTPCPGDGLTFKRDYRSLSGTVSKI